MSRFINLVEIVSDLIKIFYSEKTVKLIIINFFFSTNERKNLEIAKFEFKSLENLMGKLIKKMKILIFTNFEKGGKIFDFRNRHVKYALWYIKFFDFHH